MDQLAKIRESTVLAYITGDRIGAPARIGDDAVRPFHEHLRDLSSDGKIKKLDLFIYSRGGGIDIPWRLVSAIRNVSESWSVLIPYRANSAATMIALGADEIVMGPQAELGPIDPALQLRQSVPGEPGRSVDEEIRIEDVMAYVEFMRDRVGLTDQNALTEGLKLLTGKMDAVVLGNIHRTHTHIRDVARRIVMSRSAPPTEQVVDKIVSTLAERVYAHGHAISRNEARDLGLEIAPENEAVENLIWELLEQYEDHMHMLEPFEPAGVLESSSTQQADIELIQAVIESSAGLHEFKTAHKIWPVRQLPQQLNVTLNVSPQVPEEFPEDLAAALQQMVMQIQQALGGAAVEAAKRAVEAEMPVTGIQSQSLMIGWKRSS